VGAVVTERHSGGMLGAVAAARARRGAVGDAWLDCRDGGRRRSRPVRCVSQEVVVV